MEQDEAGRVTAVHWRGDAAQPFRLAIEAMLDAKKPGELPRVPGQTVRWEFNPYDGDVRIGDAAAILKKMRFGDADAASVKEAELDEKPVLMQRVDPVFPSRLSPDVKSGEAVVEFFRERRRRCAAAEDRVRQRTGVRLCSLLSGGGLEIRSVTEKRTGHNGEIAEKDKLQTLISRGPRWRIACFLKGDSSMRHEGSPADSHVQFGLVDAGGKPARSGFAPGGDEAGEARVSAHSASGGI